MNAMATDAHPFGPTAALRISATARVGGPAGLASRVEQLEAFYRWVHTERMQGLPILNPALQVEAVGFRLLDGDGMVAGGVLITPWFMSLVCLPLTWQDGGQRIGCKRERAFGNQCFEFIGAHDPAIGWHEACALFSPMGGFDRHELARETACAVLASLFAEGQKTSVAPGDRASRRAFLLGRRAGASS